MLTVSVAAAILALFITPPSAATLAGIDWKTLATLFMLLSVLDGFKHENLFLPVLRLTSKIRTTTVLGFFLVFGVFFSSMFVTNDVSLIIFVPLTMLLFRQRNQEKYILPMLTMENIAAVLRQPPESVSLCQQRHDDRRISENDAAPVAWLHCTYQRVFAGAVPQGWRIAC